MNQEERHILVALISVPTIGRQTIRSLRKVITDQKLSWQLLWSGKEQIYDRVGLTQPQQAELTKFQRKFSPASYLEFLAERKIAVLTDVDTQYPPLLRQVYDPPLVLFVKGPVERLTELPVAVVGTRHPSIYGKLATEKLTTELVFAGATIISGFMYGVDLFAHQTAVKCGGYSVGVLGFGFDHFFPRVAAQFKEEFLAAGNTLMTEFLPEVPPLAGNFPVRNRIVAGLSLATVVVEAAAKSGSLITAQCALEAGRFVGAVPGPITSEVSDGTRNLLNQGAEFVGSAADILEELGL